MSYSKFLDDLNDFYKDRHKRGLKKVSLEEGQNVVRDRWLNDGRHQELISYALENWDSGNCDEFIKPLVDILVQNRDSNLLRRLWKGVIRHRIEMAWTYFSILQEHFPNMQAEALDKIDLSNFNLFRSSNEDIRSKAAYRRQFALNGITEFIGHLSQLGETEEIKSARELYQSVYLMRKPTPKPSTDPRKINEDIFWELIDGSRKAVADQYEFLDKLKPALEAFKPNEIRKFQKILLTKLNELHSWQHWALAYIVRRGCGDDEFDYFRAWAVSKGLESFEAIKGVDTRKLRVIFSEDPQLEPLLSLAETVYEEKTGEIMKEVKVRRSKLTGREWVEENLRAEFPDLCELFEYPR